MRSLGFFYLFAGEAELELGPPHRPRLDWLQRAQRPFIAGLAARPGVARLRLQPTMGDQPNAAKYIAALKQLAPARRGALRRARKFGTLFPPKRLAAHPRILEGLRLALCGRIDPGFPPLQKIASPLWAPRS